MDAPERQQIIRLAQRLARRAPGAEVAPEKAAQFREWAEAILSGVLEPPAWLEREDRTEELRDSDIEARHFKCFQINVLSLFSCHSNVSLEFSGVSQIESKYE